MSSNCINLIGCSNKVSKTSQKCVDLCFFYFNVICFCWIKIKRFLQTLIKKNQRKFELLWWIWLLDSIEVMTEFIILITKPELSKLPLRMEYSSHLLIFTMQSNQCHYTSNAEASIRGGSRTGTPGAHPRV